jgi:type I restriction enzyme S subunit
VIPWVSPKDVKRPFLSDTQDHLSESGVEAGSRLVPAGTVFVVVRGMALAKDLPVSLARVPMAFNQDIKALVPRSGIDPEYLLFALQAHKAALMKQIGTAAHGTRRMGSATLENFAVPLPELREQRGIARNLTALYRAIDAERSRVAALRELKAATMAKLFREGLRGERLKPTEIGEIPESWAVRPLRQIATLLSGGTPSKTIPTLWTGGIPWVSPKDLKRPRLSQAPDHVSEEAVQAGSTTVAPAGAIFVVVRGMILARDVPIALAEARMAFNQDLKAVIPRGVASEFLFYAMLSQKSALETEIGVAAHGTRRIGTDALERWLVPVAPSDEQGAISTALRTIERRVMIAEETERAARELFGSALHLLMSGQVRVPEAARS